jgi:hypothetical protein
MVDRKRIKEGYSRISVPNSRGLPSDRKRADIVLIRRDAIGSSGNIGLLNQKGFLNLDKNDVVYNFANACCGCVLWARTVSACRKRVPLANILNELKEHDAF